jgi:hypothetical protein
LFHELDVTALEQALGGWVQGETLPGHVAIDGKRLRGSATGQTPGTHLLAAFSARLQGVIGQLRVDPDANEITAALKLLKTLPLAGVTAIAYNIACGSVAAYYPEANNLCPLEYHDKESGTPSYKSIPVRVHRVT